MQRGSGGQRCNRVQWCKGSRRAHSASRCSEGAQGRRLLWEGGGREGAGSLAATGKGAELDSFRISCAVESATHTLP